MSLGPPDDADIQDYVLVAGKCYPHALLQEAINTATLDRLAQKLPEGVSPRRAALIVRDMKTKQEHGIVMREALRRVAASGEDVPLAVAIRANKGLPIAAFPTTLLDSRSTQQ
jgi:hypothetical protein